MGKEEDKVELGTSILNIPEKTYKALFSKCANKLPSIYLIYLGNVKELRKTFDIDDSFPDDSGVYKYGFTDDLGRRMGEHETKYGKLENVKLVLTTFHGIDPQYLREAEHDIKDGEGGKVSGLVSYLLQIEKEEISSRMGNSEMTTTKVLALAQKVEESEEDAVMRALKEMIN